MSSAFSSGDSIIQNQSPVTVVDHVRLHEIWNSEQKHRCLRWIEKHNLQRVALQFPDSILPHIVQIVNDLKSALVDELCIFVLADTSYGSCCIDEIAAAHANADGIVHFGHACLSKVSRIPVLYVFFQFKLEEGQLLATLSREFVTRNIHVTCFYEDCYTDAMDEMRDTLVDRFPNMVIANLAKADQKADIMHWKLDTPHESNGLVLYIGRDNLSFFNTAVALKATQCYLYDPTKTDPQLERTDAFQAKWLRRRYYAIERCMDAGSIGIVVATLSTKGYLEIVSRVQRLAKTRGVRTYLISIGKVNPEKLANFIDIDCFVLVGCPENDIFTSRDFFRPLLSVFEAEMALNQTWKEKLLTCYTTNFPDLLPNGRLYSNVDDVLLEIKGANEPADVSLITGKARNVSHRNIADTESKANETCTDVASKRRNELAQISSADQFTSRFWQGLEQNLGHDVPALVQMGRSGVPIMYENERNAQPSNEQQECFLP
ncbi:2-(3-amino-3-carboxypropyl)histidine synthase subunit 2 [Anopheles marshallii]|uniref:2-(3-amino-3-carboxypropyl)histidine synthase subunit 2 n=1 Tax=Anopheles marshallii TaxID=1521116 RepID=UPI00237A2358|nr:2-(3-amino-3-carboxypropyl)histidine synthase subunit 2 [Anopheles marshallii]